MTDKQIIDVSKCKEYGLRNCEGKLIHWCHTYDDHCQDFDNCYYKQLKRKEQECERLNTTITNLENIRDEFSTKLDQLKAENKHLNDLLNQALKELEKTRETLTEIKEICNKESGWVNCSNNMPTETAIFAEQILQKISECEVE